MHATLAGLQREFTKPRVKKEPITATMLTALVSSLGPVPSLGDVRLVAISLLAFAAFLRYDEISKLRCCDITFSGESMTISIRASKTDQYHQGDKVVVARTGSPSYLPSGNAREMLQLCNN